MRRALSCRVVEMIPPGGGLIRSFASHASYVLQGERGDG